MVKKQTQFLVLMILLAALPATSQAQDLTTILNNVTKAMGSANLKTIRYSGSGSSYTSGKDVAWVKSYTRDIDLNAPSIHVQIVRQQGTPPAEQKENQSIASDAPWSKQFELWTNPWEFLKVAATNKATVSAVTDGGQKYTVVSFMVQNRKVNGFINDQNVIEKVQTWVDPNDTLAETVYRDYQDFNGIKVPTMIIQKQAGELALIVLVNDVKPNAPIN